MGQEEATGRQDERLTRLEMRTAEQDRTIEDLSGQIAQQWTIIDQLQKRVDALTQRLLSVEDLAAPAADTAPPPHY